MGQSMSWTAEDKLTEVLEAPLGTHVPRDDVRIVRRPGWYQVIRPNAADSSTNEVIISKLSAAEADDVIDQTCAEYASLGLRFKWILDPRTEPTDMGRRLRARGFESWLARGMCCSLTLPIDVPNELEVDVVTAATLDDFVSVMCEGWQIDPTLVQPDSVALLHSPIHTLFVARHGAIPVGTAFAARQRRSTYLMGAVVLPEHRGKGAYRALLQGRLRHAADTGAILATTQARETTSAPILKQLGFETVCDIEVFRSPPPG